MCARILALSEREREAKRRPPISRVVEKPPEYRIAARVQDAAAVTEVTRAHAKAAADVDVLQWGRCYA